MRPQHADRKFCNVLFKGAHRHAAPASHGMPRTSQASAARSSPHTSNSLTKQTSMPAHVRVEWRGSHMAPLTWRSWGCGSARAQPQARRPAAWLPPRLRPSSHAIEARRLGWTARSHWSLRRHHHGNGMAPDACPSHCVSSASSQPVYRALTNLRPKRALRHAFREIGPIAERRWGATASASPGGLSASLHFYRVKRMDQWLVMS